MDVLDEFQTAPARQRDVRQNKVGLFRHHRFESLLRVLGFAADLQISLAANPLRDAFPRHRMVIDKHDPLPGMAGLSWRRHILKVQTTLFTAWAMEIPRACNSVG
jgi:hypothetical protein